MKKTGGILILLVSIILILHSCGNKKQIKLKKWNDAYIVENSTVIGENSIGEFKKGVFRTSNQIDEIKKAYFKKGYIQDFTKENRIKKENITIDFIEVDEKNINILIDIKPREKD